jgi:dnd system-associated protein 4
MPDIGRNAKYESIVNLLAIDHHPDTGRAIFPTIMDLLVFAAMVGIELDRREKVEASAQSVPWRVFQNNHKDGLVMLVGLWRARSLEGVSPAELDSAQLEFEQYANGGLQVISEWLQENPADANGDHTLLSKITDKIAMNVPPISTDELADVEF